MTGRAAGYCAGYDRPGYANNWGGYRGYGYGMGRRGGMGRGFGRGYRNVYRATGVPGWGRAGWAPAWGAPPPVWDAQPYGAAPSKEQELNALRNQAEQLSQTLQEINERIETLSVDDES